MNKSLLRTYISALLSENRIADLQKKYPAVSVKKVANKDPSGKNKYLEWMLKQIDDGEWEENVFKAVTFFDKNQSRFPQKDINAYKTYDELIDAARNVPEESRTQEKNLAKRRGATKIYEDSDSLVIRPNKFDAMASYARNTKWCITTPDNYGWSPPGDDLAYDTFYFVISKTKHVYDPFSKLAIQISREQDGDTIVWNAIDQSFDPLDERLPEEINNFEEIISACYNDAKKYSIDDATP